MMNEITQTEWLKKHQIDSSSSPQTIHVVVTHKFDVAGIAPYIFFATMFPIAIFIATIVAIT